MTKSRPNNRLADRRLSEVMRYWRGDFARSRCLVQASNAVYDMPTPSKSLILRILNDRSRNRQQIEAELRWIEHLASCGMTVCRPVRSLRDRLIETVSHEAGSFHVCAFERAPGAPATRADLHRRHMMHLGSTMASMHNHTQQWPSEDRLPWHFGRRWLIKMLCDHDPPAGEALQETFAAMDQLPQQPGSFGLIHNDIHIGNYHLHDEKIWLFDFDNCGEHWHISDLATTWYFSLVRTAGRDMDIWRQLRSRILAALVAGYRQVRPLSDVWIQHLPLLCQYRALFVYAYMCNKYVRDPTERRRGQMQLVRAQAMEPTYAVIADLE